MKKWQHLLESDADLRSLERTWRTTGNAEDALRYARTAERYGRTKDPKYYEAIWASGEKPNRSKIYAAFSFLSETYDDLARAMGEAGIPWPQIQTRFRLAFTSSNNEAQGMRQMDNFEWLIARGIQRTADVTHEDLLNLIEHSRRFVRNIPKVFKPHAVSAEERKKIDAIRRATDHLSMIAGR